MSEELMEKEACAGGETLALADLPQYYVNNGNQRFVTQHNTYTNMAWRELGRPNGFEPAIALDHNVSVFNIFKEHQPPRSYRFPRVTSF